MLALGRLVQGMFTVSLTGLQRPSVGSLITAVA